MSLAQLLIITLSALGGWDILRRLLPVRMPVTLGKSIIVVLAWVLITHVPAAIIISLAVPGLLMILSAIINPEPVSPWGPGLWRFITHSPEPHPAPGQEASPADKVGHRIPRL